MTVPDILPVIEGAPPPGICAIKEFDRKILMIRKRKDRIVAILVISRKDRLNVTRQMLSNLKKT